MRSPLLEGTSYYIYFTSHGYDKLHKLNHKIHKRIRLHYLELINAIHNPNTREQHTTHPKKNYMQPLRVKISALRTLGE